MPVHRTDDDDHRKTVYDDECQRCPEQRFTKIPRISAFISAGTDCGCSHKGKARNRNRIRETLKTEGGEGREIIHVQSVHHARDSEYGHNSDEHDHQEQLNVTRDGNSGDIENSEHRPPDHSPEQSREGLSANRCPVRHNRPECDTRRPAEHNPAY